MPNPLVKVNKIVIVIKKGIYFGGCFSIKNIR
jgi:hypothetical protein